MMVEKIIYKKKKKNPGDSVSLMGARESGSISGRLPDDPGGFTCMRTSFEMVVESSTKHKHVVQIPDFDFLHGN